jgi:hypothetical protein
MAQGRFHSDKSGNRFNMLTLIMQLNEKTSNGSYKYIVQCDCGESKVIGYAQIASGRSKSCGCLSYRKGKESHNFKHGLSLKSHPEYKKYNRECYDKHRYNLQPEQKQALVEGQNNSCAICGYEFGQKKGDMKVDHCHTNGNVRGLLCDLCNRGLGYFKDNVDNLKSAINYLDANAR